MFRPFRLLLSGFVVVSVLLAGAACSSRAKGARGLDTSEINAHVGAIRDAIRERSVAGIVARATPDWTFTGADGVAVDRATFVARTEELFARVVEVESLLTTVDRLIVRAGEPGVADVEITQDMIRRERAADGSEQRWLVRYREKQEWVHGDDGWRVRRVALFGPAARTSLQPK